jgi:glycerol kinase
MVKNTYGTGCFMLMHAGDAPPVSHNRLLSTVGWTVDGRTDYLLEGSVFMGGATVQWLRDGLGIIKQSSDVEALALSVPDSGGVMLVPAFVGLGAPHWDAYARGTIVGMTRGTTAAHIARAAVEASPTRAPSCWPRCRRMPPAPCTRCAPTAAPRATTC